MQRGRRSFTSRSAGRIDPEEVIEPLRIGHVVIHMPPQVDEFLSSIRTPPPEPISVNLVKRSKQHDDPLVLNLLKHCGMLEGDIVRPETQRFLDMEWQGVTAPVAGIFEAIADQAMLLKAPGFSQS